RLEKEAEQARSGIGAADVEGAKANGRAAEAQKLAGPRNIREPDRAKIRKRLEQFRGAPYDLTIPPNTSPLLLPPLLEPGSFLVDHLIVTLSILCGWELKSVEGSIPKARLPFPLALSSTFREGVDVKDGAVAPTIFVGQMTGILGIRIVLSK